MPIPEYISDYDQSSSFLRMAIKMMNEYKLPPNLVNLTLVYEYILGNNTELKQALQQALIEPDKYNENTATEIYKNYIWDDEKRAHNQLNEVLNKHFADVLVRIRQAHSDTAQSNRNLEQKSQQLDNEADHSVVKEIVQEIIQETQNTLSINKNFEHDLEVQKNELERVKQELAKTRELAQTDPLTHLKNRRFFEQALSTQIEQFKHDRKPLSLIMLDIDFFKRVNDTYGHTIGDKVIKFIAKTLSQNVREDMDVVARIGGEEFAVLLPNISAEKTRSIAEKIRQIIEKSRLIIPSTKRKLGQITISSGITTYQPGEKSEAFIERADRALYASKEGGRNCVTMF